MTNKFWLSKLFILSSVLYVLYFIIFFVLLSIVLTLDTLKEALSYEKYLSMIFVISGFVFNSLLYAKLKGVSKRLDRNEQADRFAEYFINNYGAFSGVILVLSALLNFAFLSFTLFRYDLYLSVIQSVFAASLCIIVSASFSFLFFSYSKKRLYVFSDRIKYRSLTLFAKFSIPILSTVFIVLIVSASVLFRMTYNAIYSETVNFIQSKADGISSYIANYFQAVEIDGYAVSNNDFFFNGPIDVKSQETAAFVKRIYERRRLDYILGYYLVNREGESVDNRGENRYIYNYNHFMKMAVDKSRVLSNLEYNFSYLTETMECLVPLMLEDKLAGGVGTVIQLDQLKKTLNETKITESSEIWLINTNGQIVYHPRVDFVGFKLREDFHGKEFRDTINVQTEVANKLGTFLFQGVEKYFYKISIPVLNQYAVFVFDKKDITDKLNMFPIQIMVSILSIGLFLFLLIFEITKSFSSPIKSTIVVLEKLSTGDLTQKNTIYLPDEFGDFLKHFTTFQDEIIKVISIVQNSSSELSSAAANLAETSINLSESAQNQASSVEESSASLEEVAGSIELIADSAKEQSALTDEAYNALREMNDSTVEIAESAKHSVELSNRMTDEVKSGFSLMQGTREKMNEIKKSTTEIADIIQLIQDISDQVNLLSLNAAIEAARAGDHGRGFAVVASEITKLADQTAESAKSIRELVEKGLIEVKNGSEFVDSTTQALENVVRNIEVTNSNIEKIYQYSDQQQSLSSEVIAKMETVKAMADNISFSTQEQKTANKEMVVTLEGINQITQNVAQGSEKISSSTTEISAQAESLKDQIGFFKVN